MSLKLTFAILTILLKIISPIFVFRLSQLSNICYNNLTTSVITTDNVYCLLSLPLCVNELWRYNALKVNNGDYYMICNICPRKCNAVRTEHSGEGFCKMGELPTVARVAPHFGEEPCISGTNGSGTVFFRDARSTVYFVKTTRFHTTTRVE